MSRTAGILGETWWAGLVALLAVVLLMSILRLAAVRRSQVVATSASEHQRLTREAASVVVTKPGAASPADAVDSLGPTPPIDDPSTM